MIFQILVAGFAVVGAGWFAYLVGKHGFAWVRDKFKARALAAEATLQAKAVEVTGALEPRLADVESKVRALAEKEVATLRADVDALKAKAGA